MKTIWIALLGVVVSQFAAAQNCRETFSGKVTDSISGQPLVQAVVYLKENGDYVYTDEKGHFAITAICRGEHKVEIAHPEFDNLSASVSITKGKNTKNFQLNKQLEALETIEIEGRQFLKKSTTGQEESLGKETLESYSSKSLGDAIEEISGVSSQKTGTNIVKPVIHGLSGSRVPVINEGTRLADQQWGKQHAPNIDLNSAEHVTVVKGASALQYGGDAIGGIVTAEKAKAPKIDSLFGETLLSGSTNGRGGSVTTSLTKSYENGFYGRLQGTFKKFGDHRAPDYNLANTGTTEGDFSLNFGLNKRDYGFDVYYSYYNKKLGILRSADIGNISDLVNALNTQEPFYKAGFQYPLTYPRQEVRHHLLRLKLYKRFEGLGKLKLKYSYQRNHREQYDLRTDVARSQPVVSLRLKTHDISAKLKLDTDDSYNLNFGISGNYQNNFADPKTGVRRVIPDYDRYQFGAFATGDYQIDDDLLVEAGLRYDYSHIDAQKYYLKYRWKKQNYDEDFAGIVEKEVGNKLLVNPVFNYNNFSGSVGLKYGFDKGYHLKFNYALASRAPNPSELFSDGLHQSDASVQLGDLRNVSETSNKFSLNFIKDRGRFSFNVAPFFNYVNNFINLVPTGVQQTIRGSFPLYEFQQIRAGLVGLDLDAGYRFDDHFSYKGSLSYQQGTNFSMHRPMIAMPATQTKHSLTYKLEDWHQFHATINGKYVFKRRVYPNYNFEQSIINEDGNREKALVDISTPPDAYFLMGLRAGAVFYPFDTGSVHINLLVDNLLDTSYRNYQNRLRYYADETGRNVSLQLKFNY